MNLRGLRWLGSKIACGRWRSKVVFEPMWFSGDSVTEKLTVLRAIPAVFLFSPYGLPELAGMTGGSISGPYICIHTKAKTNSITAYMPKTPYFLCTNYVYSVIHLGNPKGISNSINLRQNWWFYVHSFSILATDGHTHHLYVQSKSKI